MYCPECGAHLTDGKDFCGNCGKRIGLKTKTVYKPDIYSVGFGVIVILIIYTLPVTSTGLFGNYITTAKAAELCSSPIPVIRCTQYINWIFLVGWIVGIISILAGIFNQVKEKQ